MGAGLEADNVGYTFPGGFSLEGISFGLEPGNVLCVLGPNGSGKTTLLNVLSGFALPLAGRVLLNGVDVHGVAEACVRDMVFMPFQPGVLSLRTPYLYWQGHGQLYGLSFRESAERIAELAPRMGLAGKLHVRNQALSLGMQQKMYIIAGFMPRVNVRIFDEPFSGGVDPLGIEVLAMWIEEARSRGEIVVFSSQLTEHAERLATKILVLRDGKMAGLGTAAELIEQAGVSPDGERPLAEAFIVLTEEATAGVE